MCLISERRKKMPANQYLEKLMSDYGDTIFRMCFLYLKDYQLAEDAAQETFIKAMTSYEKFEHKSSEKTWLTRIAINCCKNIMRTNWFQIVKNNLVEYQEKAPDNLIDDLVEKNSISNAIMKLDLGDRKVIVLYYYQELSIKDIAAISGISENTVNQRLYRARKRLKKILMEDEYDYEYQESD